MPAKSEKQRKYMALCATKPAKARSKCPPKAVAEEYMGKPKCGYRKPKRR